MAQLKDLLVNGSARVIGSLFANLNGNVLNFGVCSTAAATAAKTVTTNGTFELITGSKILVLFSETDTSNAPTLNVNGTGAKSIKINASDGIGKGFLAAQLYYWFIYDGTNWRTAGGGITLIIPTQYGGTGNSSYTANRIIYSNTATKLASGSITTDGAYLSNISYLSVNRDHLTDYKFYVNGTSYFNGNTTHNGIDYFANGTTYYINNSAEGKLSWLDLTRTSNHGLLVGTIRGKAYNNGTNQTGEYIHMYERVHIGSPSGWGSRNAPLYGLSTYGGAWFATDTGVVNIGDTSNTTYKLYVNGSTALNNGNFYFNSNTGTYKFYITRSGGTAESTGIWVNDSYTIFDVINDETTANVQFKLLATDTEGGGGAGALTSYVYFYGRNGKSTIFANCFGVNGDDPSYNLYVNGISRFDGNLTLYSASGDSRSLIFNREDSLTDWRIYVTGGLLSFASATDASTWTRRAYFLDGSGTFVPGSDAVYNLGQTDLRWKNIFLSGSTKRTNRIYPYVTSLERSQWYKITFPYYNATTDSSAKWFMNSFDLHIGGGYNNNPAGVIHITFYWTRAGNNGNWAVGLASAHAEGPYMEKVVLYYRIEEPGILYVNNNSNNYNGIWLDNLYVDDTAPSLDWSTTKIETCSAITVTNYTIIPTSRITNSNNKNIYFYENTTKVGQFVDGALSLFPQNGSYREGLRIHSYGSWSDILLCGNDKTDDSGTSANSWFIGNNNGSFYITRNGSSSSSTGYLTNTDSGYWHLYNKVGVNGKNTSYTFYVNGTSYFNGNTTHAGNVNPEVNNTRNLGNSSLRWNNIYAYTLNANLLNGTAYPLGKTDKPYHEIARFTLSNTSLINTKIVLLITNFYGTETSGILEVSIRQEVNATSPAWIRNQWLVANNIDINNFITTWSYDSTNKITTIKIYIKDTGWHAYNITRLIEHNWGSPTLSWILYSAINSNEHTIASIPNNETLTVSSTRTITNNAISASLWLTARTFTIGATGKSVNGTSNVSWTTTEINRVFLGFVDNYRRSVIALCELSAANTGIDSYWHGKIFIVRHNGNDYGHWADVDFTARYSTANGYFYTLRTDLENTSTSITSGAGYRACVFKYNNKYYGGLEFQNTSSHDIYQNGVGTFTPFRVIYYNTETPAIINQEIYDSLSFNTNLCYRYSIWTGTTLNGNLAKKLTIQANGTQKGLFNNSADVTVNLGNVAQDFTGSNSGNANNINADTFAGMTRQLWLNTVYPVGSIYMSVSATSPATLFGGTWESLGGRFLIGQNGTYTAGSTGGEASHTLTLAEAPAHTHGRGTMNITGWFQMDPSKGYIRVHSAEGAFYSSGSGQRADGGSAEGSYPIRANFDASRSWTGETDSKGGGSAHNNMPPYLAVYMWKRTA